MSCPNLTYDPGDQPTEKDREHQLHRAEGHYYSWCGICVEEELCPDCKAQEPALKNCLSCESSGRRL